MFSYKGYRKPYFNHGLNSVEQMQDIWSDIMFERWVEEAHAKYKAYIGTDQYWKDYISSALEDFLMFPYDYGMEEATPVEGVA